MNAKVDHFDPIVFERPGVTLTRSQVDAFGREIDALREEIMADLGEQDARYIRRLVRTQKGMELAGRGLLFLGVLVQLTIMPDVLIVQNYATLEKLSLVDTITGIAIPYVSSAFGIFLLRQTFMTIPKELDDAARLEGCSLPGLLRRVYIPLAKPVYVAYGLVSISHHWNNFLWPLVVARSVETRPLTVGLAVFASTDQGIDWSIITAATLLSAAPLLIAFLIFQRAFVQSFMRAGIK